jgi:hypothetical protein
MNVRKANNATILADRMKRTHGWRICETPNTSLFRVGPPQHEDDDIPTTDDAIPTGTSCHQGTVGSPGCRILHKIVSQRALCRNVSRDVRITQTPVSHSTPLVPGMAVQSTPPAPTHPPHDSTFRFVSTHSNVPFSPGIGHLVCLSSSQGVSRRTRRAPPEAAMVFAVTAGRDPGNVSHIGSYWWAREGIHTAGTVWRLDAGRDAVGVLPGAARSSSGTWGRALTGWARGARRRTCGV